MGALGQGLAVLGAAAAAPVGALALALRPSWRVGLSERLGAVPEAERGSVWVHGASVGEAFAASRLVRALAARGRPAFVSASTPGGRGVLERVLPEVPRSLAPVDHPWCVDAAIRRVQPVLLALVETELWPTWITRTQRRGVPVVIVSGRLSDRSFPRYRRLRRLLAPVLRKLDAVGARSEVDAERFVALGVPAERVLVTGDLKLEPLDAPLPLAPELAKTLSGAPIFVAGSTHPGEERAAELALRACERAGLAAALVVAPRHVQRADAVEKQLRETGRCVRRRSELQGAAPLSPGEVLVLDTVGELGSIYELAVVAFVGGTLTPTGGHNVLEPLFAGCPVLFGPALANVRGAAEIAERSGAGRRVSGAEELGEAVIGCLRDPDDARRRGADGRQALDLCRGSAERTASLVERVIEARQAGRAAAP